MAVRRTPTDPMPTTHRAIREEIKYWQERFQAGSTTMEDPVRKRLEALYALDRASGHRKRAPLFPADSRVRASLRLLVQSLIWLGVVLKTLVLRRKK